jgi:hypothetical protein
MKRFLSIVILLSALAPAGMAQLKAKAHCPDQITVDVLNGTVNNSKPNTTANQIKEEFPCFTSAEEGSTAKCGGGVFFKDRDLYFYTQRKYVEVGPKFTGKTSIKLLGTKRGSLFNQLGNPKIKDDLWEAYEMQYGTLVLHFDVAGPNGKVKYFQFSTLSSEELNLCE